MFVEVGGREELRMLVLKCGSGVNVNKYFVSKENLSTICGPCGLTNISASSFKNVTHWRAFQKLHLLRLGATYVQCQ